MTDMGWGGGRYFKAGPDAAFVREQVDRWPPGSRIRYVVMLRSRPDVDLVGVWKWDLIRHHLG
jgi:hypothetical protein